MSDVDLDLEGPGALVASATGAARFRFIVVAAGAGVTRESLALKPAVEGKGVVLTRDVPEAGGRAELDLAAEKDALAAAIEREAPDGDLLSFVVGFPGPGDEDPSVVSGPGLRVGGAIVEVTLDVDPDDPAAQDERFRLVADDGSYEETRTVKDDMVPGDARTTLHFRVKDPTKPHSLEIDPGKEGAPYWFFVSRRLGGAK